MRVINRYKCLFSSSASRKWEEGKLIW
jgi:hypothetical protein